MLKRICLGVALCLFGVAAYAAAHANKPFVFTAIPDQNEQHLKQRFGGVADYLESELGVQVKYIPVKSYAAAVTAFRNDQVQLAWFGGLSGVRARNLVKGSQAIAQGLKDPEFQTYFIAHSSTGLEFGASFPKDIRGKTFTFGSKGSTSGRLMPEHHIRENFGEAPKAVFSRVGFSGNHSKTIALVEAGSYQVGATNFKVWERESAEGKIDESKVRVIWKTPPYPDYQWTVRGDVDENYGQGFTDKIRNALLTMHVKAPELLERFPRERFIEADNDDFRPIYDVAKSIGLID